MLREEGGGGVEEGGGVTCVETSGVRYIYLYIRIDTTTQCKLLEHKWSMCTSGGKEKDNQRKMQRVAPPPVQGVFAPKAEQKMPPAQVAVSDHHHMCKWSSCVA